MSFDLGATQKMSSLFVGSGKSRRNLRPKVVHSISDSETEDQDVAPPAPATGKACPAPVSSAHGMASRKKPDSEGILSFIDQELEDDFTEIVLKKPEHSVSHRKKNEGPKKRQNRGETTVPTFLPSPQLPSELRGGEIPSPAAIHAAKKKRELARTSDDTFPSKLDLKTSANVPLVSDDDDDDEDDEGESRTVRKFGPTNDTSKQMQVLSALDNADSGSDEERFIEEQIYKGVYSFPKVHVAINEAASDSVPSSYNQEVTPQAYVPTVTFTPISVESLQSQLNSQLEQLREYQSSNKISLCKLEDNTSTASDEINSMDSKSKSLSIKYHFFQEVKGYIRDLLLCLTEKVPQIVEIENSVLMSMKKRSELLIDRRRQDLLDSMSDCSGKDIIAWDDERHSRVVEREGRRRRREKRSKVQGNGSPHYDGQSSDDELLQSTEKKFQGEIDEIFSRREKIFSDVMDDFSKIFSVVAHFREWKYNFPSSYTQAYISLCLPKLLAPYVSLQLASWNPLCPNNNVHLEKMSWLQDLLFFEYHYPETNSSDSDLLLIPRIVESTVIPKLTDLIAHVWDPLSSTQTSSLRNCITQIREDFPTISPDHRSYQKMWKTVLDRIHCTLEKDIFIPIYSPEVMNNVTSQQYKFSQRQYWTCFKLLENILMWQDFLSNEVLQELVIDGLLNRYILLSLQNSPAAMLSVAKIEKSKSWDSTDPPPSILTELIVALFPLSWWNERRAMDEHLASFLRYLKNLIRSLQESLLTEPECNRSNIRLAIDRILALLSQR